MANVQNGGLPRLVPPDQMGQSRKPERVPPPRKQPSPPPRKAPNRLVQPTQSPSGSSVKSVTPSGRQSPPQQPAKRQSPPPKRQPPKKTTPPKNATPPKKQPAKKDTAPKQSRVRKNVKEAFTSASPQVKQEDSKKKEKKESRRIASSTPKSQISPPQQPQPQPTPTHTPEPVRHPAPPNEDLTDKILPKVEEAGTEATLEEAPHEEDHLLDSNALKTGNNTKSPLVKDGKTLEPKPKIVIQKKQPLKVFRLLMSTWMHLIVIGACALSIWGYKVWIDMGKKQHEEYAYSQGVRASENDPDLISVMKITGPQIQDLILASDNPTLPEGLSFTDYSLLGWTTPGGAETEGTAEVSMCYTTGVDDTRRKSTAFFVTNDITIQNPPWIVDSVSLTPELCT